MTRQPSLFRGSGLTPALQADFSAFWKAYPPRQPNPRALAEAAGAAPGGEEIDHPLWDALRGRMPPAEFRAWIAKCTLLCWTPGESLLLQAPSRFHRDWVRNNHLVVLRGIARRVDIDVAEDIRP